MEQIQLRLHILTISLSLLIVLWSAYLSVLQMTLNCGGSRLELGDVHSGGFTRQVVCKAIHSFNDIVNKVNYRIEAIDDFVEFQVVEARGDSSLSSL